MNIFKLTCILLFVIAVSALFSCAGIGIKSDAQSEFDTGLSFFNKGQYEKAIPYFEKATELNPEFGRAYLYAGRSYLNLRKWNEALPSLRTAYRLAPEETKKEIADIIMDILLQNAFKPDSDEESLLEDFLKEK
jgi:tetratricopeptide (TPR) repeat protein